MTEEEISPQVLHNVNHVVLLIIELCRMSLKEEETSIQVFLNIKYLIFVILLIIELYWLLMKEDC